MSLRRLLVVLCVSAVVLCASAPLSAQHLDAPKAEVFGGYSWYHPAGTVQGHDLPDLNNGWGGQFTYNLNRWAGIALDANGHYGDFGNAHSVTVGPQFKLRTERFTPFAEILLGGEHFSPKQHSEETDFAIIIGGGLDYKVTPRFSIRAIQADYVHTSYNAPTPSGSSNMLNGVRLQAGVVFNFGLPKEEAAVSASCSAEPAAVDAGAPVLISVTTSGFMARRTLSYSYASTGGKISGYAASATLDSTGMGAGSYTVTARVVDNGKGKQQRTASCQATFMVNAKHPPTLSLSASPESLRCGDSSTITAYGNSPDNRPLTYSCNSTAGSLSGSGAHYTLGTEGVPEGSITVNCTTTDDRNLSASASTAVRCSYPPPVMAEAPVPQASEPGTIEFKRDARRPTRVDEEAKAELDRYADALAAEPGAKGVVVGYATAKEDRARRAPGFAAQRAVNTKSYLTNEKGIDPTRIEPRTGSGNFQKVDLWIVPEGATFPDQGTAVVQ